MFLPLCSLYCSEEQHNEIEPQPVCIPGTVLPRAIGRFVSCSASIAVTVADNLQDHVTTKEKEMRRMLVGLCSIALWHSLPAGIGKADDEKPTVVKGWGKFVDPAKDCKVSQDKGRVTITVPKTHHNLNPTKKFDKNTDAPRILQSVEGDFTVEVSVLPFPIPEKGTANNRGGHSYCAAGLVVWQDKTNFVRWFRAANGERGDVFAHGEWYHNGELGRLYYPRGLRNRDRRMEPEQTAHLRLVRRGNQMTFYRSSDRKSWEAFLVLPNLPLGKKLEVGVAAVNSANKQFAPQFENFKLTVDEK
jgi:regulation of enolase protein 1 (concanavalin A-like superfamily)